MRYYIVITCGFALSKFLFLNYHLCSIHLLTFSVCIASGLNASADYCNGKRLGVFGKLANEINAELEIAKEQKDSQNIYLGELDYEALMSCVEGELRYKPLSPYAAVKRDLALVCDEAVACGDIEETIRKASPLITEVKLFDIYRGANLGEGKKSMAFSLTLSDPAAEVSNEQVERTVKKVLGNLKFKLGIEIR